MQSLFTSFGGGQMSDETRGKEWYGNKELYEMFLNLKKEFLELKAG